MISTKDLRAIARARLRDAEVLLAAKRFDGAFYLCGNAVELVLKARLCRTLKWSGFPENEKDFKGFRLVRTHDLEVLLRLSGIERRILAKHMTDWAVVSVWNPEQRYHAIGRMPPHQSTNMVSCVKEAPGGSVNVVHAFHKAMRDISAKKGNFTLFALLKRAKGIGRWDLVVSAPWLDGRIETTRRLVDLVVKSIGRKSLLELARVETVLGHDPTVKYIIKNFPVEDGERRLESPRELFGLEMSDGIIFRAKLPERKKPARKAPRPTTVGAVRAQR